MIQWNCDLKEDHIPLSSPDKYINQLTKKCFRISHLSSPTPKTSEDQGLACIDRVRLKHDLVENISSNNTLHLNVKNFIF